MRIISLLSEKGGVAKTTTSVNLSAGLSRSDERVLIIDADPQGNTTRIFLPDFKSFDIKSFNSIDVPENMGIRASTHFIRDFIRSETRKKDINNILIDDGTDIHECIYNTKYENLDIIPSLGTELIKTDKLLTASNGLSHKKLKKALRSIRKEYDIVIIDNAPTFNNITVNTLFASNEVIIPLKPAGFELDGFINTLLEIFAFEDEYECSYKLHILMNMIPRGNRPDYYNFISKIKEFYPNNCLDTTIGFQDAVASRTSMTTQLMIDSKSNVGKDYLNLIDEIIRLINEEE